jgi:hypothetical protein
LTLGFDARSCGLGDILVSFWIAQGLKEQGHEVLYLPGQHDRVVQAFGFETGEVEPVTSFGGDSATYRHELELGGIGPHRAHLWQVELPIKVEPKRPSAGYWDVCDEWALEMKAARTGGKKPFVLLFPACAYNTRTWPLQKWTRLAWFLEEAGVGTVALNASTDGLESMPFYAYGYQIEAIISLMRVADLVIANDSGPAHLAGTLGVPTMAMMGPTIPDMVFGYCPNVEPVRISEAELPCIGCHFKAHRGFRSACDQGCEALQILPVSAVFERVLHKLGISTGNRPMAGGSPLPR